MASYQGGGELKSIQRIENATEETRKFSMPTWQVSFDDDYSTALYFSADTGEYQGTRTDSWRLNDFFMMLHFMDYGQRGDFNHWLIIFAAVALLFFASSGLLLVYSSFSKKDLLHLYNRLFSHNFVKLTIQDERGYSRTIKVEKNERLMDALAENGIELDTLCGGGGICGGCRVKQLNIDDKAMGMSDDLSEHDILSDDELKQGYRLACQLSVDTDVNIQI